MTLSSPNNATVGSDDVHTFTILDPLVAPDVEFAATSSSGAESVSSKDLTIQLDASSGSNVTVDYAITGTAQAQVLILLLLMALQPLQLVQHQRQLLLLELLMILWMRQTKL